MTIDPAKMEALEAKLRADHDVPGRFYHTFAHVEDCLARLEGSEGLSAGDRRLLRWALLWHDSVYDPERSDNEERSAERAVDELREAGADRDEQQEVRRLILLTKGHRVDAEDRLGAILVSVDLSILGAEPARYRRYAADIRREYAHVPEDAYRSGRMRVLHGLIEADPLYPDPALRERYEEQARINMATEMASLA